ncbi:hypothetical protein BVG16_19990 [Paenibacillus selenitireducens]|uniref:Uncharacterized protein n=1 Tax=Paenibacillus selenitireducens TaxID=1324314 RepID=A0A1T2X7R1_9BACL|nr:hypothetical protein BVG16_19990 [Paenibacillus selenitireducens]
MIVYFDEKKTQIGGILELFGVLTRPPKGHFKGVYRPLFTIVSVNKWLSDAIFTAFRTICELIYND